MLPVILGLRSIVVGACFAIVNSMFVMRRLNGSKGLCIQWLPSLRYYHVICQVNISQWNRNYQSLETRSVEVSMAWTVEKDDASSNGELGK